MCKLHCPDSLVMSVPASVFQWWVLSHDWRETRLSVCLVSSGGGSGRKVGVLWSPGRECGFDNCEQPPEESMGSRFPLHQWRVGSWSAAGVRAAASGAAVRAGTPAASEATLVGSRWVCFCSSTSALDLVADSSCYLSLDNLTFSPRGPSPSNIL